MLIFACAASAQEPIPTRRITGFHSDGAGLTATLLRFSRQEKLPIAVEYIDYKSLTTPVRVNLGHIPVSRALDSILGQEPGYRWQWHDGIVMVTNRKVTGRSRNLLNTAIPVYQLKRKATVQEASVLLWMCLETVLNPRHGGFVGDYPSGDMSHTLEPVTLSNKRVAQILSYIATRSGAAGWLVRVPPEHLDKIPAGGLWTIVEYAEPSLSSEFILKTITPNFR